MTTPRYEPRDPTAPAVRKKKGKFKVFLVFLAAVIGVVIVVNVASGGGTRTSTGGAESTEGPAVAPVEGAVAPGIGTPVRDGAFESTVLGVERKSRIGDEILAKDARGEFLLITATVKNIGDRPRSFAGENQDLFDVSGREYSADSTAALYLGDAKSLYEEINPGNQVTGVVVFDVPIGSEVARVELHDSAFSDGVSVALGR
ncbi:DUF4352 domain-containing protein [Saccharothrix yanglingensis]|nr:DUF4352 domain-containing protein [Saccharothrix yanglingensis]